MWLLRSADHSDDRRRNSSRRKPGPAMAAAVDPACTLFSDIASLNTVRMRTLISANGYFNNFSNLRHFWAVIRHLYSTVQKVDLNLVIFIWCWAVSLMNCYSPVSYTHLTLPTNREV